jgi:MYXO-CTERM domain-containing protein
MRNLFLAAAATACVLFVPERPAHACGGCFHSPTDNPTVVTDHRMILSVSLDQTTLYDQVQYSGSPQSFAWVLPIAGTVDVGLSADVVFDVLDNLTQTTVYAPPANCPPPPPNCFGAGFGIDASAAADAGAPPVQVLKQEVVGPYETVQLHSTDPQALANWLTSHGYAIPTDIQPVVDAYVNEGFDFLALKLVPGASVQSMRPVRVTTKGASPVLPLRMVAAGTGASVGITLWVIADGRYEPANFPFFRIQDSEIVWDWNTQSSNFVALRQQKEQASGGTAWEMESSLPMSPQTVIQYVDNGGTPYPYYGYDAGADYLSIDPPDSGADAGDAGSGETSEQVRADDMATLFEGMSPSNVRVTRIRSDLARDALSKDLVLQASADQSDLSNLRYPQASTGAPVCPSYNYCNGGDGGNGNGTYVAGGGCGVSPRGEGDGTLGAILGALAMTLYGLARRKKR